MGEQREALVRVALSQKGVKNGEKYVAWYNQTTGSKLALGAAWCAIFVSWCARQAGLTAAQAPNFAGCTTGRKKFKSMGIWADRDDRVPQRGDLIFFDWDADPALAEHVGIVTGADSGYVYTVEGNAGGTVKEKRYPRKSRSVLGYAAWVERAQASSGEGFGEAAQEEPREEERDLTKEETKKLIDEALAGYAKAPQVYHTLEEVPQWGRETAEELAAQGCLQGVGAGDLALTQEMLRVLVILDRKEKSHDDGAVGL